MKYTFSKEFVPYKRRTPPEYLSHYKVFKVYDGVTLIGQLDYHTTRHAISFGDQNFFIEVSERFLRKSFYKIFDGATNSLIGEFKLAGSHIIFLPFRDKLHLDGLNTFIFEKIETDIPISLFKKSTWGYHKFQLTNQKEAAIYSLRMNKPTLFTDEFRPFSGEIELWGENVLVLFAGLFLVERRFKTPPE